MSRKTRRLPPLTPPSAYQDKRPTSSPGVEGTSFVTRFTPRTKRQAEMIRAYHENDIVFALGDAGTGKTITAVYLALKDLADQKRKQVIVVRPAVTCGEDLGFLPGELQEKLDPFKVPFLQAKAKVAFKVPDSLIKFEALAFIRGVTWEHSVVILDEGQNCRAKQLKTFLTRLGEGSKFLILGDPSQTDISPTVKGYDCDLDAVADLLEGTQGVGIVDFEACDSVRHPLVTRMLAKL